MAERFDAWRDRMTRTLGPMDIVADDPAAFQAKTRYTELGCVQVSSMRVTPCRGRRTPRMIRRADPELFQLILPLEGSVGMAQARTDARLRTFDMALYGTSHPWKIEVGTVQGIMVVFPYTMLPRRLRRMQGVTLFSGREGVGALLSGFLTGLEKGSIQQRPGDSPRLGTILIDLLAAQLAHQLDTGAALPAESRQHTVLLQIHAFIQRHLPDTGLSPAMIAAAHNISVRQLHRLFQAEETPVAELIRNSRLERCRSDLTDPLLREVPVRTIATRWGFRGPAHFSRLFRAYYGIGPQECRRMALEGHAATRVVLRTSSGRTATRMPGSAHGT